MGKLLKLIGAVVVGFFVLIVILGIVIGIGSSGNPSGATAAISALSGANELVVEKIEFKRGQYGNRLITGTVKNPTSKRFGYAQIEINLYDKDHAQVGSTLANVNNLEPGSNWKFEAPILQDNAASAEVKGVTAF